MTKEKNNRFVGDGSEFEIEEEINFPQCVVCQHILNVETERCKAFPDGIPAEYFMGDKAHDKPINGFKFEPIAEVLAETE